MAWLYQYKGKSRNWYIGWRVGDKLFSKSTGTPVKKEAAKALDKWQALQAAERVGMLDKMVASLKGDVVTQTKTLKGAVKEWLDAQRDIAPTTLRKYDDTVNEFCRDLKASESKPLLSECSRTVLEAWLSEQRKTRTLATVRNKSKVLSSFFRYCMDREWLQASPVPRLKATRTERIEKKRREVFTLAEVKTLLECAPNDFWRTMIALGLYTGMRLGDAARLRVEAIDFDRGVIRYQASKTGRQMIVPVNHTLGAALVKAVGKRKTGFVWPDAADLYNRRGADPISKQFREILVKAGLATERNHDSTGKGRDAKRANADRSFHCFRHTFVSLLKISGGSQTIARELAGHSSDAVSDLYTHMPEDVLKAAVNQLPRVSI